MLRGAFTNYGAGSSRDRAAKAQALLGVRAVVAESFERIHRATLIGMGVPPLQFMPGRTDVAFTGSERLAFTGLGCRSRCGWTRATNSCTSAAVAHFPLWYAT
jgi:aconitate hydratase